MNCPVNVGNDLLGDFPLGQQEFERSLFAQVIRILWREALRG